MNHLPIYTSYVIMTLCIDNIIQHTKSKMLDLKCTKIYNMQPKYKSTWNYISDIRIGYKNEYIMMNDNEIYYNLYCL